MVSTHSAVIGRPGRLLLPLADDPRLLGLAVCGRLLASALPFLGFAAPFRDRVLDTRDQLAGGEDILEISVQIPERVARLGDPLGLFLGGVPAHPVTIRSL
jgi:hypothetical protein